MVNDRYFYDETLQMRYELIGKNHFATLYKVVCVLLCLALINACAYRDEGEVDYRKASFFDAEVGINDQGEDVNLAKLKSKNRVSGPKEDASISQSDYITIKLMTAFIKNYTEGPWSMLNDALFEGQLRSRGEIAILAKVTPREEFKANYGGNAHGEAHVIFYSDDVVADQFLNFYDMPVYGPTKSGVKNGLILELWIMELDTSTPIVGALLKKMATSFDLTGGMGNQVLGGLGESLLSASGANDVNFLYRAMLTPYGTENRKPSEAFLEVGHYVFIRSEKRVRPEDINWSKLRLDVDTGRLYKCQHDAQNKCVNGKEYRDNNYLVLRINKSDYQEGKFDQGASGQIFREIDRLTELNIQPLLDAIHNFKKKKDSIAQCKPKKEDCLKKCSNEDTECTNKCDAQKTQCEEASESSCGITKGKMINRFEDYWQNHGETLSENRQLRIGASERLAEAIDTVKKLTPNTYFDWTDETKLTNKKDSIRKDIIDKLMCQES